MSSRAYRQAFGEDGWQNVGAQKAHERAIIAFAHAGEALPPIEDPAWDATAEAIGEAMLHERAQLPPVVLGQCEKGSFGANRDRCRAMGLLVTLPSGGDVFACPAHGATLERAVRRWPR